MAILGLPLVISFLKPHTSQLSLFLDARKPITTIRQCQTLCRHFSNFSASALSSTSTTVPHDSSSTGSDKPSPYLEDVREFRRHVREEFARRYRLQKPAEYEKLEAEYEERQAYYYDLQAKYEELQSKRGGLQADREELEAKYEELEAEYEKLKIHREEEEADYEYVQPHREELEFDYEEELVKVKEEIEAKYEELEAKYEELQAQREELEADYGQLLVERKELLRADREGLRAEIELLRALRELYLKNYKLLEEELNVKNYKPNTPDSTDQKP